VPLVFVLGACASVPGETLAPYGVKRDVSNRLLAEVARSQPSCRQLRIVETEVLELHGDGKVAAERWTVNRCGERVHYLISFAAKGNPPPVQIRPE
jgi:hypothetical protein